jgi:hypothetical protein
LEESLPIEAYDREYSAKLDDESKCLDKFGAFHAEDVLGYYHVASRRYRQKLGEPFHNGYDDCV